LRVVVGLLLVFLLFPLGHADITGRVTHVRDGDTIELGQRVIRLQGIDAPESDQPHGDEASRALRQRVVG
jgi:endonuclease YncB( thermonuclease family)